MREFKSFDPSTLSGTLVTNGISRDEQLMLYNDSIYRLRLHFNDGSIGIIPPLWNKDYVLKDIPLGDIKWEVIDSLNIANNPSTIVYGEVYESQEHVNSVNSSMQRSVVSSIPGGISTSVVSLESTGANISPDGTNIITITDSIGNTFTLDNNGILTFSTLVGGVLVTQIKTSILESLLQLGAAGHNTEVLGKLIVDQVLTAAAANSFGTIGNNQSILGNETIAGTLAVTGNVTHTADTFLVNKKLSTASSGDLADWSGTGLNLKGNPTSHGSFQYYGDGINLDAQISVFAPFFSGTGGGTFNHNATQFGAAIAPSDFIGNPATAGGSNSNGFGSISTTQVSVGSLNAVAWRYNAMVR